VSHAITFGGECVPLHGLKESFSFGDTFRRRRRCSLAECIAELLQTRSECRWKPRARREGSAYLARDIRAYVAKMSTATKN
jgi:hypothetical protein